MGSATAGRVALMSIHPTYADEIMSGTKRVEFRKRPVGEDVTHVMIYATAPISAVIGAFTIGGQETMDPESLWSRFHTVAGITKRRFFAYFSGRATGTGIVVDEVLKPDAPLNLSRDLGVSRPPQSYQYLPADAARDALRRMA